MRIKVTYNITDEFSNVTCSFCKQKMDILCDYTTIILEDTEHQKFTSVFICQDCIKNKVICEAEFEIGDIHLDFGSA